jgi:hypothetical protein
MWASTCAAVLCALNLAAALLLALKHSPIAGAILPSHSLPVNEPSALLGHLLHLCHLWSYDIRHIHSVESSLA